MNREKENIDLWIGKVAMIGLFLFLFFAYKSTDCSGKNSFSQKTPIVHILDADKPAILGKSAIQVSQFSFKDFNNSIVACEIFYFTISNKNNILIICSNNKAKQLLKNYKEQFLEIKPQISVFDSHHIKTSLNSEVSPLIS